MAFFKGHGPRPRSIAEGVYQRTVDRQFVPPLSTATILTDRDDGTLWYLTWNSTDFPTSDDLGYISISTPPPTRPDQGNYKVYGPYDGPAISWVSSPVAHSQGPDPRPEVAVRLLVRGGYLGFEPVINRVSGGRVLPRQRVKREVREIIRPTTYADSGPFNTLAFRDMRF